MGVTTNWKEREKDSVTGREKTHNKEKSNQTVKLTFLIKVLSQNCSLLNLLLPTTNRAVITVVIGQMRVHVIIVRKIPSGARQNVNVHVLKTPEVNLVVLPQKTATNRHRLSRKRSILDANSARLGLVHRFQHARHFYGSLKQIRYFHPGEVLETFGGP